MIALAWIVLATSSSLLSGFVAAGDPTRNPFAAHNAYPWRLYPKDRFERALNSGLKHLEVDVTYDPARQAVVATHDAKPTGNEAELGELLAPLWERWGSAADDGYTLIVDFKTASPQIVAGVVQVLAPHRELLSRMAKRPGAAFAPGKITVCLTGSGEAHRLYDQTVAEAEEYLAFSDDTGRPGSWQEDPANYVPSEPAGFVRFITLEKQNFMDGPRTSGDEHVSGERLAQVVRLADAGGYRLRVYTVNPKRGPGDTWSSLYWDACLAARVHMIATDAFDAARDYWLQYEGPAAAKPSAK